MQIRYVNKRGLKPVHDYVCKPGGRSATSLNPRAFDAARAIGGCLDAPSETAGINEGNVYTDPGLENYRAGAPYTSAVAAGEYAPWIILPAPDYGRATEQIYSAVNNAQINYYIDPEVQAPFYSPAFSLPSKTIGYDYVDPMNSWKPHYAHIIVAPERFSCLSSINDTAFQREDLMARQMARRNQERSEPFFI